MNDKELFENFEHIFDTDNQHNKYPLSNVSLTIGVVVDTDDPLQMNRLRIFCPSLNDDPKKIHHLPWAAYVSPFSGVVNNSTFTRGADPNKSTTNGAVHYGFWASLEQGAHALVGCIDGDPRRRFWLGAFASQQETHTLFNGRFKWQGSNGTPDGPLSSGNEKIQPLYDNLTKAFIDRKSRQWKTRGADYQPSAVDQNVGQTPNSVKTTYLDEQYEQISNAEQDQWVKDILGAHGYDWTSFKNLGAFLSNKVFGLTTPGFHTLMMDDRAFNSRIKLRTTSGHTLLMDDTNERIYISTNEGNNWIEMDSSGNIDIYTKKRLSVHSEGDINFSTDETFRVKAKKGIHLYSGDTTGSLGNDIPSDGQIRLHSSDDFHILSNKNLRVMSDQNMFFETMDINFKINNFYVESVNTYDVKAEKINLIGNNKIILALNNLKFSLGGSSAIIDAGSSKFEVNNSNIVSSASSDVYFKGGIIQGSINSINATFITKQNGSGFPLISAPAPDINDINIPDISAEISNTKISIWTNRVPQHEPWPRGLKQSGDMLQNQKNVGYKNNAAWIDQFDNQTSPDGIQPIGKVEGDVDISRNIFWRQ